MIEKETTRKIRKLYKRIPNNFPNHKVKIIKEKYNNKVWISQRSLINYIDKIEKLGILIPQVLIEKIMEKYK